MLSSKALDALATAVQAEGRMGVSARRERARQAVRAAAEELGFDPLAPPLPRFAAGEDVLRAAALRVLSVPKLEQTLERHRARVGACRAAAARLAELEQRRRQLERVELGRMHDAIMAGKEPGPAPAKAIAERQAIGAELALVGGPAERITDWVAADERPLILEAVSTPATLGSVVFYGALVVQRLRVLTEDEQYRSPAARTAELAQAEVTNLVKRFNVRQEHADLYRTGHTVRAAVELADLHRLAEKHEPTVEELETAAAARRREALRPAGR